MNRRQFIAGTGAVLLGGCAAPGGDGAESVDAAWPVVEAPEIDRWERVDERSVAHPSQFGVTPHERTHVYENAALAEEVSDLTGGGFEGPLATFFASHVDLRGVTAPLATADRIADELRPEFEARMADNGVEEVEEVEPETPVPGVPDSAEIVEYSGHYPTPVVERSIDVPDVGSRSFTIEADELAVTGLVAVWKEASGTALAGGGVVPAENFTATDSFSITGEHGEGIDATIDVDLGLDPDELRAELVSLVEGVGVP